MLATCLPRKREKMKLVTSRAITAILLGLVLLGCASETRVKIERFAPPLVDMRGIKDIAVLAFADRMPDSDWGSVVEGRLVSVLLKTGRYRVMKADEMQRLLEKEAINFTYPPDEAMVRKAGNVLGVNAVIYGEVEKFVVKEESDLVKVKEPVWTGEYMRDRGGNVISEMSEDGQAVPIKIYKKRIVEKNRLKRYAILDIQYRMAEVFHGNVIVAESESESGSWEGTGAKEIAQIPGRKAIFDLLVDRTTKSFVCNIAPHPIEEERILEHGNFHATNLGVELAKNGLWDEAVEKWLQATKSVPGESTAYYNLGIAFERRGLLELSYKAYQNALTRQPRQKRYIEAVAHIQKLIKDLQQF